MQLLEDDTDGSGSTVKIRKIHGFHGQQIGQSHSRCTKDQQGRQIAAKSFCNSTFINSVWGDQISFCTNTDDEIRLSN